MPKEELKDHPTYGWVAQYAPGRNISSIKFNSGILLMFKTYAQDLQHLQSGTAYYVAADEELPYNLYDELKFRLTATRGYFSLAFTATMGQEFWREAIEEVGTKRERFPNAAKWQISLYDCMKYKDGTQSPWTLERIQEIENDCSGPIEVQRRVHGKFIREQGGLLYDAFSIEGNVLSHPEKVPKSWSVYCGIDYGSGGETGHPSAIVFVAVNPDMSHGRVIKAWRGDQIETTASDVILKYMAMAAELKGEGYVIVQTCYDFSARDLYTVGARLGITLVKAEKSHAIGESALNSLFKNGMVTLDGSDHEIMKLAYELTALRRDCPKMKRIDHLCFAAGTNIATPFGEVAIEDIQIGDYVHTRKGVRKVTALMSREALVEDYEFSDGVKITCTPNHRFYTVERGFQPVGSLTSRDTLLKLRECKNPSQLNLMESSLDASPSLLEGSYGYTTGLLGNTVKKVWAHCTEKFGNQFTEKFLLAMLSTTKMVTHWITPPRIWSVSLPQSICPATGLSAFLQTPRKLEEEWLRQEKPPASGINRKKDALGTRSTQKRHTRTENCAASVVNFVGAAFKQGTTRPNLNFVQISVGQKIAGYPAWITKLGAALRAKLLSWLTGTQRLKPALTPVRLASGTTSKRTSTVYNITVEGEHEYFANGILVANCDAMRYIACMIPWDWDAGVPQAIMKNLREQAPVPKEKTEVDHRRDEVLNRDKLATEALQAEVDEWNSLYET
jgi:phage terminase large subunit-like protein